MKKDPRDAPPSHAPPEDDAGLSLDALSAALTGRLLSGNDPYSAPPVEETPEVADLTAEPEEADASCDISPRTIFEAMLFVGAPDNQALSVERVASLMRGVRPAEIDELARELNADYTARACPYHIIAEGAGYRLVLCEEHHRLRDKFYGKMRQARLSQPAIEVLAAVAYNQPVSRDDLNKLRGGASGAILSQLVRRELLKLERRPKSAGGPCYTTTPRFLELFGLSSLEDLPRSEELEK